MNVKEKQMLRILEELKRNHGVVSLKAEFEAEASRVGELMRLKELASCCGVGLLIKIGGAEDISHMFDALQLGVSGMNAPMIETEFAARKCFKSIKRYMPKDDLDDIEISVNIETGMAHKNLEKILNEKDADVLDSITVGRVDMTDSLGLARTEINSPAMLDICEDIFTKARKKGLKCGLGGGISTDAVPFITTLSQKKLIDKYETRKIVFTNINATKEKIAEGILKAVEFEMLWLENKKNHYGRISHEDDSRLEMLTKRLRKEITNSDNSC